MHSHSLLCLRVLSLYSPFVLYYKFPISPSAVYQTLIPPSAVYETLISPISCLWNSYLPYYLSIKLSPVRRQVSRSGSTTPHLLLQMNSLSSSTVVIYTVFEIGMRIPLFVARWLHRLAHKIFTILCHHLYYYSCRRSDINGRWQDLSEHVVYQAMEYGITIWMITWTLYKDSD